VSYPVRFVICTYNLWNVERWPQRQEPLRKFLEHHVPDVLCIQELRPDTRQFVDEVLQGHGRVDDPFEGWLREGNIYWNWEMFDMVEYGAEDIGILEELRRLFWVRLRLRCVDDSRTLFVSTAHYTWPGHEVEKETGVNPRIEQARRTIEVLDRLVPASEPLVFMGDLNGFRHPLRILREGGLTDSFAGLGRYSPPTFPALPAVPFPRVPLDWMLHRGPIQPMTGDVVDFYLDGVPPSDHKPVLTTYRLL